tara:strand:- start:4572 stop:6785 length:2214 start_codon:yes stop_codon:yes gene_type:complete
MIKLKRTFFVATLLIFVLLGLGVALLPSLVGSETVRSELMAASAQATGREVKFGELSFSFSPPKLQIDDVYIAGEGADTAPFLKCRKIELKFSLLSILALAPVVDSLLVDGAEVHLIKTPKGILFPGTQRVTGEEKNQLSISDLSSPDLSELAEPNSKSSSVVDRESGASIDNDLSDPPALKVAVQYVSLRNSHLKFEDRTKGPDFTISILDISADAEGDLFANNLSFEVEGRLDSGGKVSVNGKLTQDSLVEIYSVFKNVEMATFSPYAPSELTALEGLLSGGVSFLRASEDRIEFDLDLESGKLQIEDIKMSGFLSAEGELSGTRSSGSGDFKIDATEARLEYGTIFRKPVGTPATAAGRLSNRDGVLNLEKTKLKISSLEADVSALIEEDASVQVDAERFSIDPLLDLFPDHKQLQIRGGGSLQKFSVLAGSKFKIGGQARLHDVSFSPFEGASPISINAVIQGGPDSLTGSPVVIEVANETLSLDLKLDRLNSAVPRLSLRGGGRDIDSRALLIAMGQPGDVLSGPLMLSADLTTSMDENLLTNLAGELGFEIRPGKLRGVSLLEDTLSQLGFIGSAVLGISSVSEQATDLEKLYGDEFEVLSGSFKIQDGIADTKNLRLVYRDYEVSLVGNIVLQTLALDMQGNISLSGKAQEMISNGEDLVPKRVIPLAHVGGTVEDPKVSVSAKQALAITRTVFSGKLRNLSDKLEEKLGGDSGKKVFKALEGLLGGGDR